MSLSKKSARQGNAFTLVELLITLVVMSFLMMLILRVPYDKIESETNSRLFVTELDSTIKYAQEISILHQVKVDIHFDRWNNQVVLHSNSSDLRQTVLSFPTNWQIVQEALITYNPNGRVRNYQKVVLQNRAYGSQIALNFQLGSGRYSLNDTK